MIKRPREINKIINELTNKGYEVYCAGECIAASYVGDEPQDWDLYTDCPQQKLREIFPDGEALGKRVTRLDYTEEVISDDLNVPDTIEGVVADIVTIDTAETTMEEQLKVYDLTVEAIAEHPQKSPIDPYGGREDIRNLILKPVGDIGAAFAKDPLKLLKPIRYAALYNFDLAKELSQVIKEKAPALQEADKEEILYEFTIIIGGKYAGKALKMIAGLGLIPALIGQVAAQTGKKEVDKYQTLSENIDKVKQVPLRRLALFYKCFEKHYQQAVEYLPHEGLDMEYLLEAKKLSEEIYFLGSDEAIKKFVYKCGWDKYYFVDKLAKAEANVYDLHAGLKTEGRDYMLKEIIRTKQPIFEEDLAIDAEDIIEAGITDSPERAEYLLSLLPAVVHQKTANNDRKILLKFAKRFNKSKFRAAFRDVKWLR